LSPQELWDIGTPLSKAALEFSPPELKKRYERRITPKKRPLMKGMQMVVDTFEQPRDREKVAELFTQFDQWHQKCSRRSDIFWEMTHYLISALMNGDLVAVGFRKESEIAASPIHIPKRFLEQQFLNFGNDSVNAGSHILTSVRIARLPAAISRVTSKKRGRPSIEREIIDAMVAIARTRYRFNEGYRIIHAKKIRDYMRDLGTCSRIPSERTIMNIIPKGIRAIARQKIPLN
jgi:hypothetical protein